MDINSICIEEKFVSGFEYNMTDPNFTVIKTLPTLSIVQSTHGSYRVSLDNAPFQETGEMGVFIAPSNVTQYINQIPGNTGTMSAQWIFFDVEINKKYKLDELFTFPLILPAKYNEEVYELIRSARTQPGFIARLPILTRLVQILLENATPTKIKSDMEIKLREYMENHFCDEVSADDLCQIMICSRSAMYQRFRELLGDTPARYLNNLRIRHSLLLLEKTDLPVAQIAASVGIRDQFYFYRLFKKITGTTATEYRKKYIMRE
jgi:AraC-like DNA-binding protein